MATETHKMLLKKAGSFLARRSYSRNDLRDKLAGLAGEAEIESTLKRLEQLNLLNDADYAYNFALYRIRQGWSPAKVQNALLRHRIGMPIIECALERVRNEVGDQTAIILDYVQKHFGKKGLPSDQKGLRKLVLHLRRRGFDDENILSALVRFIPAAAMQLFETGD